MKNQSMGLWLIMKNAIEMESMAMRRYTLYRNMNSLNSELDGDIQWTDASV